MTFSTSLAALLPVNLFNRSCQSSRPFSPTVLAPTPTCVYSSAEEEKSPVKHGDGMKRRMLEMGVGLLAATLVASTPLGANATRIEYYATVGDPLCDLTFVKSGLGFCDVAVGTGTEAPYGELINIHYTARFADGTVFDSSYKRGRPLTMRIGVGKVIKGLDQGIFGGNGVPPMQVGGKRKLQIPPELAYGPEPAGCFQGESTNNSDKEDIVKKLPKKFHLLRP